MFSRCADSTRQLPSEAEPDQPLRRRGTTAMEYLMMLSLIILVALVGVGYFGNMTGHLSKANASAISNSMKKG
jgi:hypothetical protein